MARIGTTLAAALLIALVASSAAATKTGNRDVTKVEVEIEGESDYFVDNDPQSQPSGGDLFGNTGRLVSDGEKVGNISVACTVVSETHAQCVAAFKLFGRGDLELAGRIKPESDRFTVAIVGGTREFRNSGGVARINVGDGSGPEVVDLRILG